MSPFEGGCGYTPEQVGRMTLDQVCLLLCDIKTLRADNKPRRINVIPLQAPMRKDGLVAGRTADGKLFYARIGGESLTQKLWREQQEQEDAKKKTKERRAARKRAMNSLIKKITEPEPKKITDGN